MSKPRDCLKGPCSRVVEVTGRVILLCSPEGVGGTVLTSWRRGVRLEFETVEPRDCPKEKDE